MLDGLRLIAEGLISVSCALAAWTIKLVVVAFVVLVLVRACVGP